MRGPVRLPLEQLEPVLLTPPDPPAPLNWGSIFGRVAPIEIEVGFGKGLFLLNASERQPDVDFLGIEIERKYVLFTANRLVKRKRANVRLVSCDARQFLRDCVPPGSIDVIHVYFPDPWWKKRHRKRRVFTPEFAVACAGALRDGGRLEILTDVEEYFGVMTELVAQLPRLTRLPPQERAEDYRTNFERKYRSAGKPIYGATYLARNANEER